MPDLLAHETTLRLGAFLGTLTVMALAEMLWSRRRRAHSRASRWPSNLGIVAVDTVFTRVLLPLAPVAWAASLQESGWGIMNQLGVSGWFAILSTVVIFDAVVWAQHVVFHRVPVLWRLHRMHHADTDYDTTTALRFHPFEIGLSLLIKLAAVTILGAPPEGVLLFEVVLNASALFNHADLKLPLGVDRVLRMVFVTPDMHRVHHSVDPSEHHTNFGFCLTWWDHLFGTYLDQPKLGHTDMQIGLHDFREADELRLDRMLTQPFRDPAKPSTQAASRAA